MQLLATNQRVYITPFPKEHVPVREKKKTRGRLLKVEAKRSGDRMQNKKGRGKNINNKNGKNHGKRTKWRESKKNYIFNNVGVLQRVEGHEVVEVAPGWTGWWRRPTVATGRRRTLKSSAADGTAGGGSCTRRPGAGRRDEAAGLTVDSSLGVVVAAGRVWRAAGSGGGGPRRPSATSSCRRHTRSRNRLLVSTTSCRRSRRRRFSVRRRDSSSRSSLVKEPTRCSGDRGGLNASACLTTARSPSTSVLRKRLARPASAGAG